MTEEQPIAHYLADRIADAIQQAMDDHPDPLLVFTTAPAVLATMAGNHSRTLYAAGVLADGELDAQVSAITGLLTDAADPSKGYTMPELDIDLRALRAARD